MIEPSPLKENTTTDILFMPHGVEWIAVLIQNNQNLYLLLFTVNKVEYFNFDF